MPRGDNDDEDPSPVTTVIGGPSALLTTATGGSIDPASDSDDVVADTDADANGRCSRDCDVVRVNIGRWVEGPWSSPSTGGVAAASASATRSKSSGLGWIGSGPTAADQWPLL